jgi:hypothetical protein
MEIIITELCLDMINEIVGRLSSYDKDTLRCCNNLLFGIVGPSGEHWSGFLNFMFNRELPMINLISALRASGYYYRDRDGNYLFDETKDTTWGKIRLYIAEQG